MPTDLLLRPATADDVDEITELYLATRHAAVPAMPRLVQDPGSVRDFVSRTVRNRDVWVAEDDTIVGYVAMSKTWLDALYVGPHHQGRGIGTTLLDLVKAQRPDGFSLWVFASNAAARGFYHRHGLLELEHTDGSANEERSPDVRMAWLGEDPLGFLRSQIDEVDDDLGQLLARRFALTAAVQGVKRTPGHQGRDPEREREIAERMARHVPGLGVDAVQRIMHAVIEESLNAYEGYKSPTP